MHLSKHLAQIKQIYEYVMALPKVRVLFDSADKRYFLMHLVAHHFLVIKTNAIVSRNPWSVISVFNVLSMLNHSCAPNLYHPRQGKRQYGVTVRPVKKGQQLFISYLSLNDQSTKEQRQQKLKSSWRFDCKCEKCEPTEAPFDLELTESDSCYRFLIENYDDKNNTEKLPTLFANCVEFLNKYAQSQWTTAISTIIAILVNLYIEMLPWIQFLCSNLFIFIHLISANKILKYSQRFDDFDFKWIATQITNTWQPYFCISVFLYFSLVESTHFARKNQCQSKNTSIKWADV